MMSTKNIIGAVVVLVLLVGGYYFFGSSEDLPENEATLMTNNPTATGTVATSSRQGVVGGGQTLQRLNRLREIQIDTQLFTSTVFTNLENFGVDIGSQPVGRDNPFVPVSASVPVSDGGGAATGSPSNSSSGQ